MDKLVGKREHLSDNVVHGPHSFDLLSHLNESVAVWGGAITGYRRLLLLTLQLLDIICEARGLLDQINHALLHSIPVWIVHELEEDVEDAALDLFAVPVRVEHVPELQEKLLLTGLPLLFLQLEGAHLGSLRPSS